MANPLNRETMKASDVAYSDHVVHDQGTQPPKPRPSYLDGGEEAVAMALEDGLLSDEDVRPTGKTDIVRDALFAAADNNDEGGQ